MARLRSCPLVERLDACWSAASYLSVAQIYLLDSVLLREPLRIEHERRWNSAW
ncbi:MAG: hypothetical protein WEF50_05310 [Myxococcota bacterium]